ncbi:MAG: competence/damage-inducible protein A [Phycisphaerae bacterium]
MKAIIISIGDELTSGLTINSNAAWLGRQLTEFGISCQLQLTIGDNQSAIVAAIRQSITQCDILLISGGLGPTEDDLTRRAVAEAMGEPLVMDQVALDDLEAFFRRLNRTMTENNRLQAMRPLSASCVKNSCGTAPGIMARLSNTQIFVMPGVPKEMKAMFELSYKPLLQAAAGNVVRRIMALNICGAGESWIGSRIADLMKRGTNPSVGTTVHDGIVSVRIYATGEPSETGAMIEEMANTVRQRLGELIFSADQVALETVVVQALLRQERTVTTAESCTGGWIAMMLTNVPGSSACFKRGWITYSDESKSADIGVDPELINKYGAVSGEVAAAMAQQARSRAEAHWALAVTGNAGPVSDDPHNPVGLVYIGIAGPNGPGDIYVRNCEFSGDRQSIRLRSSQMALTLLRLKLLGLDPEAILPP